jgi:hypothetical protein
MLPYPISVEELLDIKIAMQSSVALDVVLLVDMLTVQPHSTVADAILSSDRRSSMSIRPGKPIHHLLLDMVRQIVGWCTIERHEGG